MGGLLQVPVVHHFDQPRRESPRRSRPGTAPPWRRIEPGEVRGPCPASRRAAPPPRNHSGVASALRPGARRILAAARELRQVLGSFLCQVHGFQEFKGVVIRRGNRTPGAVRSNRYRVPRALACYPQTPGAGAWRGKGKACLAHVRLFPFALKLKEPRLLLGPFLALGNLGGRVRLNCGAQERRYALCPPFERPIEAPVARQER